MTPQPDIHLHSFCLIINKKDKSTSARTVFTSGKSSFSISSPGNSIELVGKMRTVLEKETIESALEKRQQLHLISGDAAEISDPSPKTDRTECSGASAWIDIDFSSQEVTVFSSLVGLPPIFFWELESKVIITSDIHLLLDIPEVSLIFNAESIRELVTIGYPIGGKTLFKDVKMLPAGHLLTAGSKKSLVISRHWELPEHQSSPDWHDFLERQSAAFTMAMEKINVTKSFLSLTAGMDTRTILAALAAKDAAIPAYTMSGKTLSLDARTARRLCKAYALEHTTVYLDTDFFSELPFYCSEACRLTGGLASLSQAHEVFYYSKVSDSLIARLSGNLGNQVGRGGAENISLRNAGFTTLNTSLSPSSTSPDLKHWYAPYLQSGGNLSFEFLLEQEIPFSSVGNYCLSNNFAAQQTPYADRQLIEISGHRPHNTINSRNKSLLAMRLKDLRHRFLGEPIATSFQRKYIKEVGGPVAAIPINWGGRAKGGVSLGGIARGMMALADTALASKGIDSGFLYQTASSCGVIGVHEYRPYKKWLRGPLREFALDTFSSKSTTESGLFNVNELQESGRGYFSGNQEIFKSMLLSLDLALAAKTFKARL